VPLSSGSRVGPSLVKSSPWSPRHLWFSKSHLIDTLRVDLPPFLASSSVLLAVFLAVLAAARDCIRRRASLQIGGARPAPPTQRPVKRPKLTASDWFLWASLAATGRYQRYLRCCGHTFSELVAMLGRLARPRHIGVQMRCRCRTTADPGCPGPAAVRESTFEDSYLASFDLNYPRRELGEQRAVVRSQQMADGLLRR
jgi:hypothetical protein